MRKDNPEIPKTKKSFDKYIYDLMQSYDYKIDKLAGSSLIEKEGGKR